MSTDAASASGPLAGIRVVEFGTLFAGPFAARILADFGAEVVKVELPNAGDPMREWGPTRLNGRGLVWPSQARNKLCVTIDLKKPEGQELARRLIARSDVVIENFRPGTMERWGLGYEGIKSFNPRVVMARVSGFGQTGPYRGRAGFGAAAGAMGGLRYLTGFPDRPPVRAGLSVEDSVGALQAVIGILVALFQRDGPRGDGVGQMVDVALTEAVLALTEGTVTEYALQGFTREREGTTLPGVAPSNVYRTRDGSWIVIAANADNPFRRLFELMSRPDISDDPGLCSNAGRNDAREQLDAAISQWAEQRDSGEILRLLEAAGVPAAPIYTARQLFTDPQFRAREMIVEPEDPELGRVPMPGVVPKLSRTPGRVHWPGPALGEHNGRVFRSVGLSDEELADYEHRGVI